MSENTPNKKFKKGNAFDFPLLKRVYALASPYKQKLFIDTYFGSHKALWLGAYLFIRPGDLNIIIF